MDDISWNLASLLALTEANSSTTASTPTESTITTPVATSYVSAFRLDGQPILPPLMTAEKRQQMQLFKEQANRLEKLYSQARAAKLLQQEQQLQPENHQEEPPLEPLPVNAAEEDSCLATKHTMLQLQQTQTLILDSTQPPDLAISTEILPSSLCSSSPARLRPKTLVLEPDTVPTICINPPTPYQPAVLSSTRSPEQELAATPIFSPRLNSEPNSMANKTFYFDSNATMESRVSTSPSASINEMCQGKCMQHSRTQHYQEQLEELLQNAVFESTTHDNQKRLQVLLHNYKMISEIKSALIDEISEISVRTYAHESSSTCSPSTDNSAALDELLTMEHACQASSGSFSLHTNPTDVQQHKPVSSNETSSVKLKQPNRSNTSIAGSPTLSSAQQRHLSKARGQSNAKSPIKSPSKLNKISPTLVKPAAKSISNATESPKRSPPQQQHNLSKASGQTPNARRLQLHYANLDEKQRCIMAATRINAGVRGFLVRRLFRTEQVQRLVQTIRDTLIFVLNLHLETYGKSPEQESLANIQLKARLLQQLYSASRALHLVFSQTSMKERMEIIARDRKRLKTKLLAMHLKRRI